MSARDFPIALTVGRVSAAECQKLINEASNDAELSAREVMDIARTGTMPKRDRHMFAEVERYEEYCREFMRQCGKHPLITFGDYLLMVKAGERPTV